MKTTLERHAIQAITDLEFDALLRFRRDGIVDMSDIKTYSYVRAAKFYNNLLGFLRGTTNIHTEEEVEALIKTDKDRFLFRYCIYCMAIWHKGNSYIFAYPQLKLEPEEERIWQKVEDSHYYV